MFLTAVLFATAAVFIFIIFLTSFPSDWQQPETLLFHYAALQQGIEEGALTPGISGLDLLKPLSLRVRGGTYESRYFAKLLDNLMIKSSQGLYEIGGPFLREPLNIALILMTAVFLVLAVHEWFSSWPGALVAGSFWLITSQTLLDASYPIRPNMYLSMLLSIYVIWQVLRLRHIPGTSWCFIRIGLALFLAFSSQEYSICLLPSLVVIIIFEKKTLRPYLRRLLISFGVAFASFVLFFWVINPYLMKVVIHEERAWIELDNASPLELFTPRIMGERLWNYTIRGIGEFFKLNFGVNTLISYWESVLGIIALLVIVIAALLKAGKKIIPPLLMWVVFYLPVSLIMFPLIPSSVEMPVYYYSIMGALFVFPVGALLASLHHKGNSLKWITICIALLVIAGINVNTSAVVISELPGAFGFNQSMRTYTRDILKFEDYIDREDIPLPIYTAYPRPRRFDVSAKWDLMLRVWHGESERVFAMMMSVLHLKLFRDMRLLGNQEEFYGLNGLTSGEYEKDARALADMPSRGWYRLDSIRGQSILPSNPPVWRSEKENLVKSKVDRSILGEQYRTILPSGYWRADIKFPRPFPEASVFIFLVRGDLQVTALDNIYHRISPIPEKTIRIIVKAGARGAEFEHTYGWSYQLYQILLDQLNPEREITIEIINEGPAEIIGPLIVPAPAVRLNQWPVTKL